MTLILAVGNKMESDYDRKFEEMKKYIPFLENMIKRLESHRSPSNPRQAQLDKIRSLRDLLQDKSKRMKMDNLLKCEQVLVNLYKKVEQRDSSVHGKEIEQSAKSPIDINIVKQLKSVVTKINEGTLPEIARASDTEEICVPGSKEPALFQRRPNRTKSPDREETSHQSSKRNYTRVLHSPEPSSRKWNGSECQKSDKPIYSRRSPKKTPNRFSPSYHKRERKRSSKKSKNSKDLNITLNVPEDKLNSLNTKDILSRIINCNNKDVEIATLRELRSQILSELKQTGASDDISDLLLKSYEKSDKRNNKEEVEEGELSDSESETIENIYGSLVLVDKDKSAQTTKKQLEKDVRKIQICLVINSDKTATVKDATEDIQNNDKNIDISDFQTFTSETECQDVKTMSMSSSNVGDIKSNPEDNNSGTNNLEELTEKTEMSKKETLDVPVTTNKFEVSSNQRTNVNDNQNTAENFTYNYHKSDDSNKKLNSEKHLENTSSYQCKPGQNSNENNSEFTKRTGDVVEIPLLDLDLTTKQNVVSEIDILQALKKEILNETDTVLGSETVTPALHQPKLNKVESTPKSVPKRTISIEKYKEITSSSHKSLFVHNKTNLKDDVLKKQSLKLTEKECERFNLPTKLSITESSEDETSNISLDDIYDDLAPKSPDHDDFADTGIKPPVIIPSDPIKPSLVSSVADIDMRKSLPNISPNNLFHTSYNNNKSADDVTSLIHKDKPTINLVDPRRARREQQISNREKPSETKTPFPDDSATSSAPDTLSNLGIVHNMNAEMTPSRTPGTHNMANVSIPNINTNASCFDNSIELDNMTTRKNVYTPMFSDLHETNTRDVETRHQSWDQNSNSRAPRSVDYSFPYNEAYQNNYRRDRYRIDRREPSKRMGPSTTPSSSYGRMECPTTPLPSFGRSDGSSTPLHSFGRSDGSVTAIHLFGRSDLAAPIPSYGRSDGSATPVHSFGRSDGSSTPIHSFGRSDGSATPIHSYGRSDGSATPINSFGRSDGSATPIHSFGRSDGSATPAHSFGRSDGSATPIHTFGRLDGSATPIHSFGRSDGSGTPIFSFGRSDGSATPIHSFGRSDGSVTPVHSFGISDGSTTPIHSFGRSEGSTTPIHSFGRSEGINTNYAFGRTDLTRNQHVSQNKYSGVKDPRLNRSHEHDNNYYNKEDGGRGYRMDHKHLGARYPEQGSSYSYHRYRREQSVGRNENSRFQDSYENKYQSDHSLRDLSSSRLSNPDQDYSNHSTNSYDRSSDPRRNRSSREKPIDKGYADTFCPSSNISSSLVPKDKLYVQPSVGTSFTIDTSINRTFQELGIQNSFDARRKRASSVSRVTNPDTCKRTFDCDEINTKLPDPDNYTHMGRDFQRARSVGRDTLSKCSQSFNDIKNDLRSFTLKTDPRISRSSDPQSFRKHKVDKYDAYSDSPKFENYKSGSKSNFSENNPYKEGCRNATKGKHISLSQRRQKYQENDKNYNSYKSQRSHDIKNRSCSNSRYTQYYGNVYSDDNISKGKIQGPDAVKKYKIPKIKRSPEKTIPLENNDTRKNDKQQPSIDDAVKSDVDVSHERKIQNDNKKDLGEKNSYQYNPCDKKNKNEKFSSPKLLTSSSPMKDIANLNKEETNNAFINYCEQRPDTNELEEFRTNENSMSKDESKQIMNHASFDKSDVNNIKSNEVTNKLTHVEQETDIKNPSKFCTDEISVNIDDNKKNLNIDNHVKSNDVTTNEDLNSSFGDLEIFSENIVTDPGLDNLNDLIAELDNDLEATKMSNEPGQFVQELCLEKMMDSITTPEVSNKVENNFDTKCEIINVNVDNRKTNEETQNRSINIKEQYTNFEEQKLETSSLPCNNTYGKNPCTESVSNINLENLNAKEKHTLGPLTSNINLISKKQSVSNILDDSNENTVSTTKEDVRQLENSDKITEDKINRHENVPIPDSTININDKNDDKLCTESTPDSTIEANDNNNQVTSSHSTCEDTSRDSKVSCPPIVSELNDFSKLLSILEDKHKVIELLSLLKDKPDSDKMKKKLEKLSELVFEDNDNASQSTIEENPESCSTSDSNKHCKILKKPKINESLLENKEDKQSENEAEVKDDQDTKIKDEVEPSKDKKGTSRSKPECKDQTTAKIVKVRQKKPAKKDKKKPILRSNITKKTSSKRPNRELLKLQEDLREMFIKDDVLNNTGLRMCRIAKLVDEKTKKQVKDPPSVEYEPIVRLEKFKNVDNIEKRKPVKKVSTKSKSNKHNSLDHKNKFKKVTKTLQTQHDPFEFETDSISDTTNISEKLNDMTSESESDSGDSTKSTEPLSEIKKKPKRKRFAWQAGVVPKNRKKKRVSKTKNGSTKSEDCQVVKETIPDLNCYIDKLYCYVKNVTTYTCRLCIYKGDEIVDHYRTQHPHTEIPLSRMSPDVAMDAIKQCENLNFQIVSKLPSNRYVCRFCFKEFAKSKNALQSFFWHIVNVHTGEYMKDCTICDNNQCPFELDIPPAPINSEGQLIGYLCGNCNYTQISIENLKSHVLKRHNDEHTEVSTINLAYFSQKTLNAMLNKFTKMQLPIESEKPRVLRSNKLNTNNVHDNRNESSDSDVSNNLETASTSSHVDNTNVYQKSQSIYTPSKNASRNDVDKQITPFFNNDLPKPDQNVDVNQSKDMSFHELASNDETSCSLLTNDQLETPNMESQRDIFELPHFKVKLKESGMKEYVCCVNNNQHYTTSLLISLKKHVKISHNENWDGYCFLCKVIVTSQGKHKFIECLQHFLDNHLDDFPVLEDEVIRDNETTNVHQYSSEPEPPKPYLTLRPLSELISDNSESCSSPLPIIESVMSLGTEKPVYPRIETEEVAKQYLYEEAQAEIMTQKHRIVLNAMMSHEKLAHVFKCAGTYCSFTTDNAEDALLHATTHMRVGGENALRCSYCDYDASNNAIDLITHVFKAHGCCQFACGFCFYRAAASQLVNAHIDRVHDDAAKTVLKASFVTDQGNEEIALSRELAVPFYY
ncbi:unnamed protein product [Leptidea sinapis]|uniref:C2H2-type domain-containing protein n=1 Tax=Leptidea sinapis TaxID=189913 RepID=A0A5E4QHM9_9NEOP|nr:unnamed protein product [Leptidea sinapis]